MGKLLRDRWGVPLLGVVPELAYLGQPTLRDLERALQGELIAGLKCRNMHYGVTDAFLVTTGLRRFLRRAFQQRDKVSRRVYTTHARMTQRPVHTPHAATHLTHLPHTRTPHAHGPCAGLATTPLRNSRHARRPVAGAKLQLNQ